MERVFANDIDEEKYKMYGDTFDVAHFPVGDEFRIVAIRNSPLCAVYRIFPLQRSFTRRRPKAD